VLLVLKGAPGGTKKRVNDLVAAIQKRAAKTEDWIIPSSKHGVESKDLKRDTAAQPSGSWQAMVGGKKDN